MPRKTNAKVEEGYLRSLWEEIHEMELEFNAVVTVTMYATTSRGVFTVEMRALEAMVLEDNEPLSHSITKRLPDGGSMPFAGALWYIAERLNAMIDQSRRLRAAAHKQGG